MAAGKIKAWIDGSAIRFRFPLLDGMREWASEEMRAAYRSTAQGWFYEIGIHAASLLKSSAPLAIEASPELARLWASVAAFDFMSPSPSAACGSLPQPERRVFDAWGHQLKAFHFLRDSRMIGLLSMGMGTGKTKTLIDAVVNEQDIRCGLVICPPKVCGVWRREFRLHAPQVEVLILDDSYASTKKKQAAAERFVAAARLPANRGKQFVVVINYESARMKDFALWSLRQAWCFVALDESHRAKDAAGATGKYIDKLRLTTRRRILLTGTPMPHSPADLFSQYRFLDPSVFGSSFFVFKKRYAITGFFKEIVGWRHKAELSAKFHSRAIVIGEDVLDLPPLVIVDREFAIGKESMGIYRDLWIDFCAELSRGVVTIDNALVKIVRAQQVTSGFLPVEDELGVERNEVLNDDKEQELAEVLEDAGHGEKVVVFCRWKYDLASVRRVVERLEWQLNGCVVGDTKRRAILEEQGAWRHYRCGEVSGFRLDLTPDAKLSPDFEVFAVQVQSGGVGVDFTDAAIAVLYSIDFSLGNYDQMLKRLHRPGQKRAVRIIRLIAAGTVDRQIYTALSERRDVVESIVQAAREADHETVNG